MNVEPPISRLTPFSGLDLQFAALMERLAGGTRPELWLAAALVSQRRGEGDVCLDLKSVAETPLVDASGAPRMAPGLDIWCAALRSADAVVGGPGEVKPLILDAQERLYLRRYWWYETEVASALLARASQPVHAGDTPWLQRLRADLNRLFPKPPTGGIDWQRVAVFAALRNRITVISGGPGTGKTRTVVAVLALLLEQAAGAPLRLAVAAPTGKAAGRLQESLRAQKAELTAKFPAAAKLPDEVTTVHRLLGTVPGSPYFRHDPANPLPVDVLVVDEASMVDLALLAKLLRATPAAARVVLLGDRDQLASIEAGYVLGDIGSNPELNRFSPAFLRDYAAATGVTLPARIGDASPLGDCLVELRRNHRFTEDSGIYRLSQAVNRGNPDAALATWLQEARRAETIAGGPLPLRGAMKPALREGVLQGYGEALRATDVANALVALGRFRILAAVREGPQGVTQLNALVEQILEEAGLIPRGGDWYPGRQVLVTANDYSTRLFNGDLGVAWAGPDGSVGVWFAGPDGAPRRVAPARLPAHETAFALTVHKSQGSEFEEVLLILPERPSPVVTRELLYTGLTRARRRTEVWASEAVFRDAVSRRTERASGLREQLWGLSALAVEPPLSSPKTAPPLPDAPPDSRKKSRASIDPQSLFFFAEEEPG